ncbi:putative thiol oxidase [Helianthus anomalus]
MINSNTRATFIKFMQIMVAHNPSRRLVSTLQQSEPIATRFVVAIRATCRRYRLLRRHFIGSADILVNFDDIYPSNILSENIDEQNINGLDAVLHTFQICGKQVPRGYWVYFCLFFFERQITLYIYI